MRQEQKIEKKKKLRNRFTVNREKWEHHMCWEEEKWKFSQEKEKGKFYTTNFVGVFQPTYHITQRALGAKEREELQV